MHCPRCHAEPPRDPFVCTHCGERLLTYLDEPFGPGTGVRAEELGGSADALRAPDSTGVAVHDERERSWIERQIDPQSTESRQSSAPDRPGAPHQPDPSRPKPPADVTGPLIWKVVFGVAVAVGVLIASPFSGLLMLGAVALFLWRWPRAPFIPYASVMIAIAAALWVIAELLDMDSMPSILPEPTPTIQRAFATATRTGATPTPAPPTQQTLSEDDSRFQLLRAQARWQRGDTQAAVTAANRAVELATDKAAPLNMRALVRVQAGDLSGAEVDAAAAVAAEPSSANYHDTHGYTLLKLGRNDAAVAEYNHALATLRGTNRGPSQLGIGLAYVRLGQNLSQATIYIDAGLSFAADLDPDPQLADLEATARQVRSTLPGQPSLASPAASPVVSPAASPTASPGVSPAASPVALRADGSLPGRAP